MLSVKGQKSFVYFYMSQDTRLIIFLEQDQQLFTAKANENLMVEVPIEIKKFTG